MNAFLITNYNKQRWVKTWIKIIRNFSETYFVCVTDNGGHQFSEADLNLNIPWVKPYYLGEVQLINTGMAELCKIEEIEYIIKTSADTWMFSEQKLFQLISYLKNSKKDLLSCSWNGRNDVATDFFIISKVFANKLFPLDFNIDSRTLPECYLGKIIYKSNEDKFFRWSEREPIHDSEHERKMIWENLSLVTSHNYEENLQTVLKLRPELKGIIEAE